MTLKPSVQIKNTKKKKKEKIMEEKIMEEKKDVLMGVLGILTLY